MEKNENCLKQEKDLTYIRAIRAVMERKGADEVRFVDKVGTEVSVRIPSSQEGVRVTPDSAVIDGFEEVFRRVFESLYDVTEDRLEADDWFDRLDTGFIRNGVAVTVDAIDKESGRYLSEIDPASPWLGVIWHVDDGKLSERHANPGEMVLVDDGYGGNRCLVAAEEIVPHRPDTSLPDFDWYEKGGMNAGRIPIARRILAEQFVSLVKDALEGKYVPFHIALSGKEACIEYHPAGDPDGKTVASYRHWQEPETGMKGEDAYYDGDHVPREYCKGTLDDWFGKEPGENTSPEHVLYHLLKRFGVCVDVLDSACVYSGGPYESNDEDLPFPEFPVWSLVEDAELSSSPLNQRIRHLSCGCDGKLDVFTRTDLDDLGGKKDVCQVFLSLADFAAGVPDAEFPDGEQNFEKFCDIIDKAYGKAIDEHDGNKEGHLKRLFREHVRAMMSECFPSEEDFDEI